MTGLNRAGWTAVADCKSLPKNTSKRLSKQAAATKHSRKWEHSKRSTASIHIQKSCPGPSQKLKHTAMTSEIRWHGRHWNKLDEPPRYNQQNGGFLQWRYPQNGWVTTENHTKMDDLGVSPFQETRIWFKKDGTWFESPNMYLIVLACFPVDKYRHHWLHWLKC